MQVTAASPRMALLRRSLARDATEASSAASESSWSMVDHNDDDALKPAASPANERLSSHISADALSELDIDENLLCDACDEMVRLSPAEHSILHPYTVPRVSLAHTLFNPTQTTGGRLSPAVPFNFTTHHNATCVNWYCSHACSHADDDCWCLELTGHMCEACCGDDF